MKLVILGGSGMVGSRFIELKKDYFEILAPDSSKVDILNKDQISQILEKYNVEAVINFAAYTAVEKAEEERGNKNGMCYQINAIGAKNVADACKDLDKYLIHISTEYVFDGTKDLAPYVEEDIPNPINWYGATKYFGEQFVMDSGSKSAIARLSMPYSPSYELKKDIVRFFLEQLKAKVPIKAIDDQRITPILVDDIVNVLSIILEKKSEGIYHVSAIDSVTPLEFVKTIAETFHLDYSNTIAIKLAEYTKDKKAKLLKYSWLNPAKFEREFGEGILHTIEEGLQIFKNQI